ncbi:MAG: hypothetical protein ACRBCJ_11060 [Hyphomicrobiaceae bacterium]
MKLVSETRDFLVFEQSSFGGAIVAGVFALVLIVLFATSGDQLSLEQTYVMLAAILFSLISILFIGRTERVTLDRTKGRIVRHAQAIIPWFPLGAIAHVHALDTNSKAQAQSALQIRHKRIDSKSWQVFVNGIKDGKPWSMRVHKGTSEASAKATVQRINAWLEA